ncbi:hypothetical protein FM038_017120 [Shewanella eurypsychrophilus]|uniref:Photosynthesis system II assembly factor Ycf48/Hcf136-like domain-containing protein n=1 Tax=Shewanella eurypsychrophilus TaxID=2593656 RepID=A0ABX6V8G8_9GAMM|nr:MULTISPECIES: hypothetical protein [Shewanella]QFU23721.1 hypothetical protein FS418_18910 [Shewanella sp. YLB-09]QPG58941.1 hypothetical protein FM038_017120 [Shewanella eurypsychrophilus]
MADKLFSQTNGDRAIEIGESVMLSPSVKSDAVINGARYLEAGSVETDPSKFDLNIFINPVFEPTPTNYLGGSYSCFAAMFSKTLNKFICIPRTSQFQNVTTMEAGLDRKIETRGIFPSTSANEYAYRVIEGGGLWVVGASEGKVITSSDLDTWVARKVTGFSAGATNVEALAYGNGVYVAGASSQLATSIDTISWSIKSVPAGVATFSSAVFSQPSAENSQGVFLVGARYGKIIRSTDNGDTWAEVVTGLADYVTNIKPLNGSLYAVSSEAIAKSDDDGATWILINIPVGAGTPLYDIEYVNGYFIITMYSPTIRKNWMWSKDFSKWELVYTGGNYAMKYMCTDGISSILATQPSSSANIISFVGVAAGSLKPYVEGSAKQFVRVS